MPKTAVVVCGVGNCAFAATFLKTIGQDTSPRGASLVYIEDVSSGCDFFPFEDIFYTKFDSIVRHEGRGGCNELWNQSVRAAAAEKIDYLIVANDDIMSPKKGMIQQMVQVLERNPHIAMVGIGSDGAWEKEHRAKERWFTDPSLLVEAAEHCESFRDNPVKYVHHVSGPLWACKPKLWLEAGGIPEAYFWGFGEVVPCIELRKMGYQSAAVQYPCTILHYGGGAYYDIHSDRERDESFSRRSIELGDDGKLFAETYGTGHVHLLAQEFDAKLPSMGLPPIQYEISRKMED